MYICLRMPASTCAWMRASFSLCSVASDWFWRVESWQSVRLSQEARDHRAATTAFAFFFFLSVSILPISVLSHSTRHPPFNLTPFTPCYFYPPLWQVYWYVTLIFIAGQNEPLSCRWWVGILMWVNKRQSCLLFALREFTAAVSYTAEIQLCQTLIHRMEKNNMCEMERSQGTLQIFNIVAYWHSLQSIHSPITYCPPLCVFSAYRYCTRKGVRK